MQVRLLSRAFVNLVPDIPPILRQGEALIEDIAAATPAPGEVAAWWLGQHSFVVKLPVSGGGYTTILIDPFLTPMDERRVPPLFSAEQMTIADVIVGTHDHLDHIDRAHWPALAAASDAVFVAPKFNLPELAESTGIDAARFIGFNDGESQTIRGVTFNAHACAHEFLDRDPRTGFHPWLGYVMEADGVTVHHPGDTVWYEGLFTRLLPWRGKIDLALYPINGRDAARLARNCLGNMTFQEAVDLAGHLEVKRVMPTHWDMFADNPGDPAAFEAYLGVKFVNIHCARPSYSERVTFICTKRA